MTDKFPDRNEYLGPSEAAMACGLSNYCDRVELWEIKTLRRARPETTPVMERGNWMEPLLIARLENDFGIEVFNAQLEMTDKDRDYLRGHCDGIIKKYHYIGDGEPLDDPEGFGICEIKAPGSRMSQKFSREGLSPDYIFQAQLYMHLANVNWCSLFYLDYDSNIMKQIDVVRNQGFIEGALRRIDAFWDYVKTNTKPPMEVPPLEVPGPSGEEVIHLGDMTAGDLIHAFTKLEEAKELAKKAENVAKTLMTEGNGTTLEGKGIKITWKESERTTIDSKRLLRWTEMLCNAVVSRRNEDMDAMAELYFTEAGMFTKTTNVRTFRKKVS